LTIERTKKSNKKLLTIGLSLAIVFVVIGVLVFSYANETLDVQAENLGVQDQSTYSAPFSDYTIASFDNALGNILLGVASTFVVFGVTLGVAKMLKKSKVK
jgi:uncharacterized membrane protein